MNEKCKRYRDCTLLLRYTEDEKSYIVNSANKRKMSVSNYILETILQSKKSRAEEFVPLLRLLRDINKIISNVAFDYESNGEVTFALYEIQNMQIELLQQVHKLQKTDQREY